MKYVDAGNSMVEVDCDVWPVDLTPERARDLADAHFDCEVLTCSVIRAVVVVLGAELPPS